MIDTEVHFTNDTGTRPHRGTAPHVLEVPQVAVRKKQYMSTLDAAHCTEGPHRSINRLVPVIPYANAMDVHTQSSTAQRAMNDVLLTRIQTVHDKHPLVVAKAINTAVRYSTLRGIFP